MARGKGTWEKVLREGFSKIDQDFALLIGCLREVLEDLGHAELVALLPGQVRRKPRGALPERGAQAISIAFQLLNLVEENAAQQAIRARESAMGASHRSGLWAQYLRDLKKAKVPAETILQRIRQQTIEPVLTGHPTEAKRWTVLDQHRALYVLLVQLENSMYTDEERRRIREKIKAVLEHLWRTGEILMTKPDVRTERLNALYYFRERFPGVLERLDDRFRCGWQLSGYGDEHPLRPEDYPKLCFGSWVGGDRDGHPLVTAEVTQETLAELRQNALRVLDGHLRKASHRLGLSSFGQKVPEALVSAIRSLRGRFPAQVEERLLQSEEEPWRQFVVLMRARLPMEANGPADLLYRSPEEMRQDLCLLAESLESVGAQRIAQEDILPLQRVLDIFGFHLARLDIRQNSAFHERAVAQLMDAAGLEGKAFLEGDEASRLAFLEAELQTLRPFTRPEMQMGPEARATVDTLLTVRDYMEHHGRSGIGALIVSMTRSLSDLLAVFLLCREAGLMVRTPTGPACLLPVAPLFETLDDLRRSAGIMDAFLAHPITRSSLAIGNPRVDHQVGGKGFFDKYTPAPDFRPEQLIMIGYSDSNKDSGILASQWGLHAAQENLLETGKRHGVGIRFFHGRGGTVSRGAGPTHRFLEALPEGSLLTGLRLTEQGETVAQKFTNFRTAAYNLELLMAGTIGVSLSRLNRKPSARMGQAMNLLAEASRAAYERFLKDPGFMTFYRQATPIDVLEVSRIGSRPSRRTGQATLSDLRAIPWVFSWTQARFYFPGWFGVGTALAQLRKEEPILYEEVLSGYQQWPFLRYVLFNIESGLASADPVWMKAYGGLVEDPAIQRRLLSGILKEYKRTCDEMNTLLGGALQDRRPRFFKTLHDRDAELNLLHGEQVRLLKVWRASSSDKERTDLLPQLLLTVNAIASGLRTTG